MTIDLLCLVADKNMEAAVSGLLSRPRALGIRPIARELIVHPEHDPGCFHNGVEFLHGLRSRAEHALVLLDLAWQGVPAESATELESQFENNLARAGMRDWARAVVIEPELEAWVFGRSKHVPTTLGWQGKYAGLREALASQGLWPSGEVKPPDPKTAMEWALRSARTARSSSIYRDLAKTVSTKKCKDRSFLRFRDLLQEWFPA